MSHQIHIVVVGTLCEDDDTSEICIIGEDLKPKRISDIVHSRLSSLGLDAQDLSGCPLQMDLTLQLTRK